MRSDSREGIGLIWAGVIGQACVEVFISMDGAGMAGRFSMEFSVKKSVTRNHAFSANELASTKRSTLEQSAALMRFISPPVRGLMIPK